MHAINLSAYKITKMTDIFMHDINLRKGKTESERERQRKDI